MASSRRYVDQGGSIAVASHGKADLRPSASAVGVLRRLFPSYLRFNSSKFRAGFLFFAASFLRSTHNRVRVAVRKSIRRALAISKLVNCSK